VLAVTALAGCATTQQEAARLRLNSARLRAAELRVRVTRADPDVRVEGISLLAGRGGSAIVVRLHNLLSRPVSDLPISVGVISANGRRVYLNGAPGGDYFTAHTPAIESGGVLSWVLTTRRALSSRAHPFAAVGRPALASGVRALPRVEATATAALVGQGRGIRVVVRNLSTVPQYGLQVYLVANRAGRAVGAGRMTLAHLGNRASTTIEIRPVGDARAGSVAVAAAPTIFS
jgi:hypothetical protein